MWRRLTCRDDRECEHRLTDELTDKMSHPLFELLDELDAAHIHYALHRYQADTVMVTITLVGERIEAAVFSDGHIEVARFTGTEAIEGGAEFLQQVISQNRD